MRPAAAYNRNGPSPRSDNAHSEKEYPYDLAIANEVYLFMKIKKRYFTGGGRATRLWPITTTVNKHLPPLANKPMIFMPSKESSKPA